MKTSNYPHQNDHHHQIKCRYNHQRCHVSNHFNPLLKLSTSIIASAQHCCWFISTMMPIHTSWRGWGKLCLAFCLNIRPFDYIVILLIKTQYFCQFFPLFNETTRVHCHIHWGGGGEAGTMRDKIKRLSKVGRSNQDIHES